MSQYPRSSRSVRKKLLLWALPVAVLIIFYVYMNTVVQGWSIFVSLSIGIFILIRFRLEAARIYEEDIEKSLEVGEGFIKLIEPARNYEGFIRFQNVVSAEISRMNGEVYRIRFIMKNGQRIDVAGYDGLVNVAEAIWRFGDFDIRET